MIDAAAIAMSRAAAVSVFIPLLDGIFTLKERHFVLLNMKDG